ncbi:alpha/beta fold hydrolase [Cohnella sp. CFH 77786]|uniref:alpha/beta hydrolase n=1 Tax=Cohnella sp. CFH 77786 TaxID=2662265 RepID=UPI001C609E02|nr:alpha/beta hydrolase [Cohnella sp. CFH 77786]MBW5445631.1 alpha/beta fold hydrolase [Cohnella sp. CFH 77786]
MTTLHASLSLQSNVPLPLAPETGGTSVVRRLVRLFGYLLLSGVFALTVLYAGVQAYIAWKLTHPYVSPLVSNPMQAKNLPYSDVHFPSADGQTVVDGWWIPVTGSRQSVVLSHGYGANREESWVPMYDLADLLHRLGYNVLMFDYGFASAKHRLPATGGILESQQLLGAIHYAREQGTRELIVWGFSMGAGTALQAALQHAPVDAMILDSTFLPDDDTLAYNLNRIPFELPKLPTLQLIKQFLPIMGGTSLDRIPSERAQHTTFDFPMLLIHGTADDKAPVYLAENVAKAQTNPYTQLWTVQGAIHEMIYRTHKQEYVKRITAFLGEVHVLTVNKAFGNEAVHV